MCTGLKHSLTFAPIRSVHNIPPHFSKTHFGSPTPNRGSLLMSPPTSSFSSGPVPEALWKLNSQVIFTPKKKVDCYVWNVTCYNQNIKKWSVLKPQASEIKQMHSILLLKTLFCLDQHNHTLTKPWDWPIQTMKFLPPKSNWKYAKIALEISLEVLLCI